MLYGLLLLSCLLAGSATSADQDAWPFPDERRSELVFIHHLVNYAEHPEWRREWERDLQRGDGLRSNIGSVKTKDFRTDLVLNLNTSLGPGWRFLYRMDWYRGLDRDHELQRHWLGLERGLFDHFALRLSTHPTPDKEDMDLQAGVLIHSADHRRYLNLGLRFDDFQYTEKNDLKGVQTRRATALSLSSNRHPSGARLQLSLSHEPGPGRFGGDNAQYQMLF